MTFIRKIICLLFFLMSSTCFAAQQIIMVGPCRIIITAVGPFHMGSTPTGAADVDTPQAQADVAKVAQAIQDALDKSVDMLNKTNDACGKNGNDIHIMVYRGAAHINHAKATRSTGSISVDLQDIENIRDQLSGPKEAVDEVADSALTGDIAHEMDHLRDAPGNNHKDPGGADAGTTTGPAINDANLVRAQMGFKVRRLLYAVGDPETGVYATGFIAGEEQRYVTWYFITSVRTAGTGLVEQRINDAVAHALDHLIPSHYCDQLSRESCYPLPVQRDSDLDGMLDRPDVGEADNCPTIVNPQQSVYDC